MDKDLEPVRINRIRIKNGTFQRTDSGFHKDMVTHAKDNTKKQLNAAGENRLSSYSGVIVLLIEM